MLPSAGASIASHPPLQPQYDTDGQLLLSPSQQKAYEKQREWEAFIKILRQTEQLNGFFDGLADKTELLEDGGQSEPGLICAKVSTADPTARLTTAIARVVENWQNVFRATHIALSELRFHFTSS